jgi:hypothetical protein|tara:strand:- start:3607 stop:4353 length:747 start_codon:yes stop_codon:yes gene_type:complete
MENKKHKFPTETIDLPSKGLIYPEDNTLSSGKVEMKYMTAKEEDILTNQSYIEAGTVLDKLLQSLIVSDINYNDLITGDKNALLIAARVLGYGKDYKFEYKGEEIEVDLSVIDNKEFDESSITKGENRFSFTLPNSKTEIEYKILTANDEKKISAEIRGLKKVNKKESRELSTRLKYMIVSVDGEEDKKTIREFVDTYLLAMDSRALRKHIADTQPDVNLDVTIDTSSGEEDITIPINLNFFWPDAEV